MIKFLTKYSTIIFLLLRATIVPADVILQANPLIFKNCEIYSEEGVNERRSNDIGYFYEKAYKEVGKDLNLFLSRKMKIFIYDKWESMVEGLIKFSGYSYNHAKMLQNLRVIPRASSYSMHLPPDTGFSIVIHEYTHAVIKELCDGAYKSIAWIDEGLAGYEEYRISHHSTQWPLFFVKYSIESDQFIDLSRISTEDQWVHYVKKGYDTATLIYYEALVAVQHLIRNHGVEKALRILKLINEDYSQEKAFINTIGIGLEEFEQEIKACLRKLNNFRSLYREKAVEIESIVVDGIDDDWKHFKAAVSDPKNDTPGHIRGSDIKNIYLHRDTKFLYIMFESFACHSSRVKAINYLVWIDDNIESQDFKAKFIASALSDGKAWLWKLERNSNQIERWQRKHINEMMAMWGISETGAQLLEIKIPLTSIGFSNEIKCYFGTFDGKVELDLTRRVVF